MLDGDFVRAEFGRYLHEHQHTRWGMDAALMHVCRIAYNQGAADERAGNPITKDDTDGPSPAEKIQSTDGGSTA